MGNQELTPFTDFWFLFLSIVLEGAPFIFFGTLISGFIDAYLPAGLIDKFLPKRRSLAVLMSGLMGAFLPVCECAIVPVIRRLIRKGLPVSCAITYMLSAPIINPIVVISTLNAFSNQGQQEQALRPMQVEEVVDPWFVVGSRLLLAYIVTVGVGLIVLRLRKEHVLKDRVLATMPAEGDQPEIHDHGEEHAANHAHAHAHAHEHEHRHEEAEGHKHEHEHEHVEQAPDRLVIAMRTAMRDFVDTAMYFTIGVAITALFKAYVSEGLVTFFNQSEYVGVNLMMVLAFILSLCSTSDAFIAANFPVPLSAKLSFLIYGPMMDVKLVFMYLAVFRKRFVLAMALGLFAVIGIVCYSWINLT